MEKTTGILTKLSVDNAEVREVEDVEIDGLKLSAGVEVELVVGVDKEVVMGNCVGLVLIELAGVDKTLDVEAPTLPDDADTLDDALVVELDDRLVMEVLVLPTETEDKVEVLEDVVFSVVEVLAPAEILELLLELLTVLDKLAVLEVEVSIAVLDDEDVLTGAIDDEVELLLELLTVLDKLVVTEVEVSIVLLDDEDVLAEEIDDVVEVSDSTELLVELVVVTDAVVTVLLDEVELMVDEVEVTVVIDEVLVVRGTALDPKGATP